MPMRRVHPIQGHHIHGQRRMPRASVVLLAIAAWLTLGLISQAAFQLIG